MKTRAEAEFERGSFRDPSGFVFYHNGRPHRQVNQVYAGTYRQLMQSGLYQDLTDRGLLIRHDEVDIPAPTPDEAFTVIRPEPIEFISYPYEWCFSQLKDAALLTLNVQRRALKQGMSLKDASAYNVQFHHGRPILIDSLSFEPLKPGEPWLAYRQFCQHFLAPLALMAHSDVRLGKWARLDIDGMPLDMPSRLLPLRTRLSLPLLIHLHLHARAQRRYAGEKVADRRKGRRMSEAALFGLVGSLEGAVKGLNWEPETDWADYEQTHGYSAESLAGKRALVEQFLERIEPDEVWDLGANTGEFSRVASGRGIRTLAFDFDYGAVELNYRRSKTLQDECMLPLVLDLTNPSPGLGWSNRERLPLRDRGPADLLMALALVHHLAIGNNVPMEQVASFFASLGRSLIVEFVPKLDPQVQRLLANREDIFTEYHQEAFESAFGRHFETLAAEPLPDSERRVYLMRARP